MRSEGASGREVGAGPAHGPRLGVLALGDSITNGGGELQYGVALQSWALWTARGLGLAYSGYAVDGATIDVVLDEEIPLFRRAARDGEAGRYDLGCLYVGTNDVRLPGWDASAFASRFKRALAFLVERCDRVITLTVPDDMGRPRSAERIAACNRAIETAATRHGARVVDLRRFGARNLMMADHVHPTAFGQIAIAERVLGALERDGMRVAVWPRELIFFLPDRRERLMADFAYAYRSAKTSVRAWWLSRG